MVTSFSLVAKNFISLLSSNFIVQALRFLTVALLARRMGQDVFGVYNYIILLVGFGAILGEFGLKNLAIREISHGHGSWKLVNKIIVIRLLLSLVSFIGMGLLVWNAFHNIDYLWVAGVISLTFFVDSFLLDYIMIAHERLSYLAWGNMAQALFLYLGVYFFVSGSSDLKILSLIYLFSHVVWVVSYGIFLGPTELFKGTNSDHILSVLSGGFPIWTAFLLGTLHFSMDILLLGQFKQTALLGPYSASLKVLGLSLGVIQAFVASIQPRIARLAKNIKDEATQELISDITRMMWAFLVPTLVGSWFFGPQLLTLFFGPSFESAAYLLRPLSLALAFYCLGQAPMNALYLTRDTKKLLIVEGLKFAIGAITISLLLILDKADLVPWGMAAVQLVSLIISWLAVGALQSKKFHFIMFEDIKLFLVPMIIMILPLVFDWAPMVIQLVTSALIYLTLLWFLKAHQAKWFQRLFRAAT